MTMGESLFDEDYIELNGARYVERWNGLHEEYLRAGENDYRSDGKMVKLDLATRDYK